MHSFSIFSSPEPKAQGQLIVYQSSRRLSVCLSGCLSTFSNSNISATSGPIVTKFYLDHHVGKGKAALGFGSDRIGTLVSMATDSSRRVIMGKCCDHSSGFIFGRIFFILAGNENIYNISDEFEIRPDRTKDCGISCP